MAPSTIGTFLRTFTFGHVRQLDAVLSRVLARAWETAPGPATRRWWLIWIRRSVRFTAKPKRPPVTVTRKCWISPTPRHTGWDFGEILFARMRKGSANTARGVVRFVDELAANLKGAGSTGAVTVRADSGFWSWKLIDRLDAHGFAWSITVRLHKNMKAAIAGIDEAAWVDIDYTSVAKPGVARRFTSLEPARNNAMSVWL
ncbi:MAG: transposase [Microthrixaceae bacterium]